MTPSEISPSSSTIALAVCMTLRKGDVNTWMTGFETVLEMSSFRYLPVVCACYQPEV